MSSSMQRADRVWRMRLPGREAVDVVISGADEHAPVLSGALERHAQGDVIDLANPRPVRRDRRPGLDGRLTALRRTRPTVAAVERPMITTVLPETPANPIGFPLAVTATSVITAGVAVAFFSPVFALLAGLSTVVAIGRWVGSRCSTARARRRRRAAIAVAGVEWRRLGARWAEAESERRRCEHAGPADLLTLIAGQRSPWSRRLGADDALDFVLGLGPIDVSAPVAGSTMPSDIDASPVVSLEAVPVVVECGPHRGIAVCGDRSPVLASARWLVLSALTSIGPADLEIVLVTTSDRCRDWDWLKWAPSLAACVVSDLDGDELLLGSIEREGLTLVVVDGSEPTGAGSLARVLSGRVEATRLLWLGAADDVPAGCSSRLEVAADGRGRSIGEDRTQSLRWHGIDVHDADRAARWLAAFDDPEVEQRSTRLPPAVVLSELGWWHRVGKDRAGDTSGVVGAIVARWGHAASRSLTATIGSGQDGPAEIDLVADGPHALVAGTTGSGKSELLRTLVVAMAMEQPPELVSFVLIDFKGGGAFDAVACLPHVAAVVTDLDPSEASRALRGLRAEVLDRERRLRDMELSDVGDIDRSHPRAFGRLVVIVDEFAALADELPDFLDGLVDIARRGRSLGVHLILATQRPAGVVTGEIRANTNLRICLRVQDRSDSIDVVDRSDAAHLPSVPGRAILRRGGGDCESLQVATIDGRTEPVRVEPFVLHPSSPTSAEERRAIDDIRRFIAVSHQRSGRHGAGCQGDRDQRARGGATDEGLLDQIVRAGEAAGAARATPPWRPALSAVGFPAPVAEGSGLARTAKTVLGLLDDPDRRRVIPLSWDPDVDGLLVVGVEGRAIATTAAVAACALLDRSDRRPVPVFVLDGAPEVGGDLEKLTALWPVVDVIRAGEPQRLVRAVEQLLSLPGPLLVLINDWQTVVDAVGDEAGPAAVEGLVRLVRRGSSAGVSVIVTARSDRDVPQRAAAHLGHRVIHRLADPASYVSFGLRLADMPELGGSRCVDAASGLVGMVSTLTDQSWRALARRLDGPAVDAEWPNPVRVLGSRVERSELPPPEAVGDGWRVPLGLGADLDPHWIMVSPLRPVVVVAHPGGGRTTTLQTIEAALGDRVCVIDDADTLDDAVVVDLMADARTKGRPLVLSCVPGSARRFGSAIASALPSATVVLLNPSRGEGEFVRVPVPDLTDQPVGRAVAVARGRATVVQVAA